MTTSTLIRKAEPSDAEAISHLIIQTLTEVNSKDYSNVIIKRVIENFSPDQITKLMTQRQVFVITELDCIIGTASLEENVIRSVFVLPGKQGKNIGFLLMCYLEKIAREQNIQSLTVPSSVTAEGFYRKLGYKALRNEYYGEERTIIMEKHL
ncbi:TPA: GNAT family N-acetyltransferase [Legionella pneumophila]|uniref:Putative acyltransferase n=1 Tax=Legionella waltersii TaxID=66969 RepID=A0A0W1A0J4_9GAMM|nr:GNAT family N-acetyltransferase [Legionella waltersii]HAU3626770.1 GNAT family N-acetyltransferase [Legionella pneumophila]KTD74885.1 putative acyltransferase [Legionella waltersii]SNV12070.1 putative acyltransferase [Legionella waltersii]HAU3646499.1 GNAT family N-acetyltransferase [Legionella pneumophila]HAU3652858.1 GNAT family N-acetyltransferase [Legionella pneumophila]